MPPTKSSPGRRKPAESASAPDRRLLKKVLAAGIVLARRRPALPPAPPAEPPPRDEELERRTGALERQLEAQDAGLASRFEAVRTAAAEHARQAGGQVHEARSAAHLAQGEARRAADAADRSEKRVSGMEQALQQHGSAVADVAAMAGGARGSAEAALERLNGVPGLLQALKAGLDQAIGQIADMARAALEQLAKLGTVVKDLEQRGYTLVAHYSDGSERVVGRIGNVIVQHGGGGGGPPPNTGSGAGANYGLLSISANTLLPAGRYIVLVDASVAAFTATMPDASLDATSEYIFFRVDDTPANAVTIAAANASPVNQSAAGVLMFYQNDAAHFRSTGIAFGWVQSS